MVAVTAITTTDAIAEAKVSLSIVCDLERVCVFLAGINQM